MSQVFTWLRAGSLYGAPHWGLIALSLLLIAEYALPRIKKPAANSCLELAVDLLSLLLARFPGLGGLAATMGAKLGSSPKPLPAMKPESGRSSLGVLLAVGLAGLVMLAAGCAHGVTGGYQALANVATSTDAALTGFETFDHDYQQNIVANDKAAGKTQAQAKADLLAYRNKRAAVNKAFADAGAALSVGHALFPLVESGIKKQADMDAWLSQLLNAAVEVQHALAAVGVQIPGGAK